MIQKLFILLFLASSSIAYNNALWAQGNYVRDKYWTQFPIDIPITEEIISNFVKTNEKHDITYSYIFWSPFNKEGVIYDLDKGNPKIKKFHELKKRSKKVKFIPWVGGVQNKSIFLHDKKWRSSAIEHIKKMVNLLKVEEVHINYEYLLYEQEADKTIDYGKNFNLFFKELHKELPRIKISTVIASTSTRVTPFKYQHSVKEIEEILPYLWQVSFLFYDTKISYSEKKKYSDAMKEQLNHIKSFQAKHKNKSFLLGVGTFENGFFPAIKYRDRKLENLKDYFSLLKKHQEQLGMKVDGVAIFSEWMTGKYDWEEIYNYWVKE